MLHTISLKMCREVTIYLSFSYFLYQGLTIIYRVFGALFRYLIVPGFHIYFGNILF